MFNCYIMSDGFWVWNFNNFDLVLSKIIVSGKIDAGKNMKKKIV